MNIKFLMLVLLLFNAVNSRPEGDPSGEPELDDLLREGYTATELDKDKEVIILVGNTGTGKSTLSKFLRRDPTLQIEQNSGHGWMFTDGGNKIGSKPSSNSKTVVPNVDVDEESGSQVVDCAGFQKNKSPELDLLDAFLSKKILESSEKVKILIVENFVNLQEHANAEPLLESLRRVASLIGPNLHSFRGSIGLIASKVSGEESNEDILNNIYTFLEDIKDSRYNPDISRRREPKIEMDGETAAAIQLLTQILKKHYLYLQLFWRPEKLSMKSTLGNLQKLRHFIFHELSVSKAFAHKFPNTIAADTVDYINKNMQNRAEMVERGVQNLQEIMLSNFAESVAIYSGPVQQQRVKETILFCQDYLKVLNAVDSFEQLELFSKRRGASELEWREIRFQLQFSKFLHQAVNTEYQSVEKQAFSNIIKSITANVEVELHFNLFLQSLMSDIGSYEMQLSGTEIDQHLAIVSVETFATFTTKLKSLGFSEKTVESATGLVPSEIKVQMLKSLNLQSYVQVQSMDKVITATGRYIILSKIYDQLLQNTAGITEMLLIATEKLFIDTDLSLQHIHLKLVAPVVQVVGEQRVVRMLGEDAAAVPAKVAKCVLDPKDSRKINLTGVKGATGFSAGSFTVMAIHFQNKLTLYTVGGNGGVGGTGGDGCDADTKTYELPPGSISVTSMDHLDLFNEITLRYKLSVTVTSSSEIQLTRLSLIPTEGGYGGAGGSKALPAPYRLLLKTGVQHVNRREEMGLDGAVGQAGEPGKSGWQCPVHYYQCKLISTFYCTPSNKQCDPDNWKLSSYHPQPTEQAYLNQKFKETKLIEQVFKFFKVFIRQKGYLQKHADQAQLLRFMFTSDQVLAQITTQDYLKLIERAEAFFLYTQKDDAKDMIWSKHFFYTEMLQSVHQWRLLHTDDSNSVTNVQMTLISMLDTLQSFLQGKQVVRLSSLVNEQLSRLSEVDKAIEQVGKFEAVAEQKQSLLAKINNAQSLMEKVYKHKIADIQIEVDLQFAELLQKTEVMSKNYKDTDKVLVEHKKKVDKQMRKNLAVGVISVLTLCAGILYPPIALMGPAIAVIVDSALPAVPELHYDPKVLKGVAQSKDIFEKWTAEESASQNEIIDAAKEIIKEDNNVNFLQEKNRREIKNMLVAGEQNSIHVMDLTPLFVAVDYDLQARLSELTNSVDDIKRRKRLTTTTRIVKVAMYLVSGAVEVAKTVQRYKDDDSMMDHVESAIEQNKQNLNELAVYQNNLKQKFKPIVAEMVKFFDSMQSNLKSKNDFELLFQRLDLKDCVRQCITVVQKLTQDFFEKDEGFTQILNELQELLSIMMDACEKIEELRYRVPLADFAGKLAGVNCLSEADPEQCNSNQQVAQTIKTNELVREFAHILAAYQQVSFPYGESKMQLINANMLSLYAAPKKQVMPLLQTALQTIRDDLSRDASSAQPTQDTDVMYTSFSSQYKTTRPFYVWHNAKHAQSIAALLNGKQVALMALPMQPGVRNAAKFSSLALNVVSKDADAKRQLSNLLSSLRVEMVRSGESYLRCGSLHYVVGDAPLNFTMSFERDEKGSPLTKNKQLDKVSSGDVPLSPYALWKFKLVLDSDDDPRTFFAKLALLANKVDLELVGVGSYVAEGAEICNADLGKAYKCVI